MTKKVIILSILFLIIIVKLIMINIDNRDMYRKLLNEKNNNYFSGIAPRGRILDRNGKVLVDNIGVKTIYYRKPSKIKASEEIEIAYKLANIIDIKINETSLKKFWLIMNNNGNDLINEEEYKLYKERKLKYKDIEKKKLERISKDDINSMSYVDKKASTIYELMNKGYTYEKKEIARKIDDKVYSMLIDNNIKGINVELSWERVYNYGDTLKDILGTIGKIPEERKEEYLKKGYELNDIVGLSYLEEYYEEYLKGEKELYKVNKDNSLSLIKDGVKGNDLVLSIDIDVQLELERIIKENIIKAKKRANTDYFSESYAIVGMPDTGEILALSGQKLITDYHNPEFKNVNINIINSSFTVGSIVKMGTISAGYKNKVIDIGTSVNDSCIKLYLVPIKCSYRNLGRVNDLTAISKSSNYYQFNIALKLADKKYKYNMKLDTTDSDFEKLRSMYRSYGLGVITGIDLPNETSGIMGSLVKGDLLLNLSIGQYDAYTPIELFQYVNTIANNGYKKKPQLMKSIKNDNYTIMNNNYNTIDKVDLEDKYFERIKEAMHLATTSGTAKNYIEKAYNPAGKTGTSETFYDSDNDGLMDAKTTSIGFVGFAPFDTPKYSIIVLAPNLYLRKEYNYSKVYITRYISHDIMNFLFDN